MLNDRIEKLLGVEKPKFRIAHLKGASYGFTTESPVTTPSGRPVAYFRDPDDILVEILQYPR